MATAEDDPQAAIMETDSVPVGDAVSFGVALMLPLACLGARAQLSNSQDAQNLLSISVVSVGCVCLVCVA